MSIFSSTEHASKVGVFTRLYHWILIIAMIVILINGGMIFFQTNTIEPFLDYLGSKFLYPTIIIQEYSVNLINGTFSTNIGFKHTIDYGLLILNIAIELLVIMLWLKVLAFIYRRTLFNNSNTSTTSYILATITFFVIQVLLLALKGISIMIPFLAFNDLFNAILSQLPGRITELSNKLVPSYDVSKLNNVSNIT